MIPRVSCVQAQPARSSPPRCLRRKPVSETPRRSLPPPSILPPVSSDRDGRGWFGVHPRERRLLPVRRFSFAGFRPVAARMPVPSGARPLPAGSGDRCDGRTGDGPRGKRVWPGRRAKRLSDSCAKRGPRMLRGLQPQRPPDSLRERRLLPVRRFSVAGFRPLARRGLHRVRTEARFGGWRFPSETGRQGGRFHRLPVSL